MWGEEEGRARQGPPQRLSEHRASALSLEHLRVLLTEKHRKRKYWKSQEVFIVCPLSTQGCISGCSYLGEEGNPRERLPGQPPSSAELGLPS